MIGAGWDPAEQDRTLRGKMGPAGAGQGSPLLSLLGCSSHIPIPEGPGPPCPHGSCATGPAGPLHPCPVPGSLSVALRRPVPRCHGGDRVAARPPAPRCTAAPRCQTPHVAPPPRPVSAHHAPAKTRGRGLCPEPPAPPSR